jgi:hypothetical protein
VQEPNLSPCRCQGADKGLVLSPCRLESVVQFRHGSRKAGLPSVATVARNVGRTHQAALAAGRSRGTTPDRRGEQPRFPPRLPEQPIFYPVLNFEYAEQIARDWNSTDARHNFLGYVTEFDVRADLIAEYEPHQVGAGHHLELWVPAERLGDFNVAIAGEIRTVAEYHRGARVR